MPAPPVVLAAGLLAVGVAALMPADVVPAAVSPVTAPAPASGRVAAAPDPAVPAPAAPTARARSRFRWPLSPAPRVLRRFAVGPHPWSPGHRGVDLVAGVGQTVLAAGPGVVTFAGRVAGVGVVVVGHAGGLRTTYEPVSATAGVGAAVVTGTPIGTLEAGTHCGQPCLHWGALRARVYLDPLTLLRPALPVLLPDDG